MTKGEEIIRKQEIKVFDTNIFLTGIDFNLINGLIYTLPEVIDEINVKKYHEKNRNILNRIYAAIDSKKLMLRSPIDKFFQIIEDNSKISGDFKALSEVDKGLLALTLELKQNSNNDVVMYTNDYSMENLCSKLNIPFSPLIKQGIKSEIIWEVYCPFCNDVFKSEDLNNPCERCGSKLKRRPKK